MKKVTRFFFPALLGLLLCTTGLAQEAQTAERILEHYDEFREPSLDQRRFRHSDIMPLIDELRKAEGFEVQKIGESIEGRDLMMLSLGSGETDVLLWSQMHGDESTATMALFDLFNFFAGEGFSSEKEELLQNLKLHFIPMLNPDGAEVFQRRNALGVDVNRDALRLQTPEGRTLKRIRDSLDAGFGFNLHDQSRYYNAEGSPKPASISFLAPAYDFGKSIDEKRADAMQLIAAMDQVLQKYIPGHVARYNDDFEPRAFGDNIQKWGTRTVLIESGGYYGDREKQEIRKMNALAVLTALFSISGETYERFAVEDYEEIPQNDSKLFDLKLSALSYELGGEDFLLDLGINLSETAVGDSLYYRGRIADIGDLSTNHGYQSQDLSGFRLVPGAVYPRTLSSLEELEEMDFPWLLQQGYAYVRVANLPQDQSFVPYPIQVLGPGAEMEQEISLGANPSFFLAREGSLEYALINGFFLELDELDMQINGLIIR